jgi:hypothetical protein
MCIPFKQRPSPAKASRGRYVMPIARKDLSSPLRGADKSRYVMRATCEPLPSPLRAHRGRYVMPTALKHLPSPSMGEGAGGGGTRTSSPPSPPSPAKGEGVLTSPCEPSRGRVRVGVGTALLPPIRTFRGKGNLLPL